MERYDGPYMYVPVRLPGEHVRFTVEQIVHVVDALTRKHGTPPTLQEFSTAVGLRSHYSASLLIARAIRAGRLRRGGGHRGIFIVPVDTAPESTTSREPDGLR